MESKPVRIEELLAHAGWVRQLAARLVRDAGTADDVSQEVWAHALRSPPRDRSNLRAWLSAAVRNSARSLKRAEVRRVDREAAVEVRREEPATSEIVERAQLHRLLVEHVLALEEPQRSIVLAHWFEGQSVAEIARRQHMTARVVKMRLDAGHALLRQRLDRSSGGRAVWCMAFTKWIGPSIAPAGAALTVGGILVASKVVVVSAVVVVAATLSWFLWPAIDTRPSVASANRASDVHVPDPTTRSMELVQENAQPMRESIAATPSVTQAASVAAPRWIVRGHVRGAPVGLESETKLSAVTLGRYAIPDTAVAEPKPDGSFELDVTEIVAKWRDATPKEIQVVALHPLCLRAESHLPFESALLDSASAPPSHEFRCDVALVSAAVVTGRVAVPPDWKPTAVAGEVPPRPRVAVFDFSNGVTQWDKGLDRTECDAQGNWILRLSHGGAFTLIACTEGLRPVSLTVDLTLGRTIDVGVLELGRGASISGTVRSHGNPVEAGTVVVAEWKERVETRFSISSPRAHDSTMCVWGGAFEYWAVRARTQADGSFSLDGLAPVEYELHVEEVPNTRARLGGQRAIERTVQAPQSGIVLEGVPPTIELAITIGGRSPTDADLERVVLDLVPGSRPVFPSPIDLTRSADGYGKIQLIAGEAYELRVHPGRYAPKSMSIGPFEFGETHTVPFDLELQDQTSSLVLRFVGGTPEKLTSVQVAAHDKSLPDYTELDWQVLERAKDGTFVLRDLPAGNYRVHVQPYEAFGKSVSVYFLPASFDVVLPPKSSVERELNPEVGGRVRLSAKNEHGDFVRTPVELRDARGEKIATDFYCVISNGMFGCRWYLCEEGVNDHPPLPAGHYELTLTAEGLAPQVVPFDIVRGETKTLEVVLHPR